MISFKSMRIAAVALAASAATLAPLPAQALDTAEKAEVEQIIRDYLLKNPELMLEIQQALETKQRETQAKQAAEALANNAQTIFKSPNQGEIGNPQADVTVVEFFDYNCGFCQRAMNDMVTLLDGDQNIKFVMKELPILSQSSVDAARVSTAIYRMHPDRYGEFHNKLLGQEGQKDGNRALQVVKDMGLDVAAVEAESKKEEIVGSFREVNELATKLGINGTPSYVIGDEVVYGALGVDVLKEKIGNVRKCGKTNCG